MQPRGLIVPEHFLLEKDGSIATLTFNRPEKRNPLNEDIALELERLQYQIRDDADIRVVVFTGTGNTFSAGADLSPIRGISDRQERRKIFAPLGKRWTRAIARTLDMFANMEPVVIAAINGYAIGGGWSLALACDFRIAVEDAEFWFPEVDLGVPLSPPSTALLVANVGPNRAKDIILNCRHLKADEALQLGLVNQVVTQAELLPTAYALARSLADKNPTAVMVSKATVNTLARGNPVLRPDLLFTRE